MISSFPNTSILSGHSWEVIIMSPLILISSLNHSCLEKSICVSFLLTTNLFQLDLRIVKCHCLADSLSHLAHTVVSDTWRAEKKYSLDRWHPKTPQDHQGLFISEKPIETNVLLELRLNYHVCTFSSKPKGIEPIFHRCIIFRGEIVSVIVLVCVPMSLCTVDTLKKYF